MNNKVKKRKHLKSDKRGHRYNILSYSNKYMTHEKCRCGAIRPSDKRPKNCSQCGQQFENEPCGFTHAFIRSQRDGKKRPLNNKVEG